MKASLLVAIGLLAVGVVGSPGGVVHAADDQLATVQHTDYDYRVDVAGRAVHVAANLRVVNDGAHGDRACLGQFELRIPVGATNPRVMDRIVPLTLTVMPAPSDALETTLRVELQECLQYGRQDGLALTYDLPSGKPRTASPARVTEDYVAFVAWGAGRAGGSSIVVELPSSFTADSLTDGWTTTTSGATTRNSKGPIKDPSTYTVVVSAHAGDDTGATVMVGDVAFQLVAQPGDDEWTNWVSEQLPSALATMESTIGVPWPATGAWTLRETYSPRSPDAVNWPNAAATAAVGEQLDVVSLQQGLASAWFGSDRFADGWLADALADSYAGLPSEPASAAAAIDGLREEIGDTAMAAVLTDAVRGANAYDVSGDGPITWRQFLDLVEERGGSTEAQAALVPFVDVGEGAPVDERPAARATYAALHDRGGDWTPPLGVRTAMNAWDFASATELMKAADATLDQVDQLRAALAGTGIDVPAGVAATYAAATTAEQLDALATDVRSQVGVADTLARAVTTERATGGVIDFVGLIRSDLDERLADAKTAFAAGDVDLARTNAFRAITEANSATFEGVKRLVLLWGIALASLVVALTVRDLRRILRGRHTPVIA